MMIEQTVDGFVVAFTFTNLFFIIVGVAIGILFGVMPGVGGITSLSLLIPVTFYMEPITAIAFLIGITKGSTSGWAIPAILLNTPGSSENVATARDGYPLAQKGKPEKAMRMALYSSVWGDFASDVVLILLAAPFAATALKFGPAEITAVGMLAFTLIAGLSSDTLTKGLIEGPGFIEGGDILVTESEILVGKSARTDAAGVAELSAIVADWGYKVRELQTPPRVLHFKTDCSLLHAETILPTKRLAAAGCFEGYMGLQRPWHG